MEIINWILSGLTTGLVIILWFFVRKWMGDMEKTLVNLNNKIEKNKDELSRNTDTKFSDAISKFEKVADRLEDTVDAITTNIHVMNTLIEVFKKETQMKSAEIERELINKKLLLDKHDSELRVLHSKIDNVVNRCNYVHP